MTRGSTLFLKFIIILSGAIALAICIFVLPAIANDDAARHPDLAYQRYPFLGYAWLLCLAFLFALYQAFRVLNNIDKNKGFSESSINALKYIKYCAMIVSALMAGGIILLLILAVGKNEDMTGIVMPGGMITLVACVGAAIVALIQSHVQKAVELKSENDLTV